MKWLFALGAVYIFFLARAPRVCDVQTLQQCTEGEKQRLHFIKSKTREELQLLLEMEASERETVESQFVQHLAYMKKEIERVKQELEVLNRLHEQRLLRYEEKLNYLSKEYNSDLTRRILSLQ